MASSVEFLEGAGTGKPAIFTRAGFCWRIAPHYRDFLFDSQGLKLDEWLHNGQARVVKKGPHRIVYRVELPELLFFVKHNLIPDARTWLRQLIRQGKALREYRHALAVASRRVATFEPLAVGESSAMLGGESFLITSGLPGTCQLNDFLETLLPNLPSSRQQRVRKRLAASLGEFIAHLHNQGILHNDLHCGNILIRLDEDDHPLLHLIDLQAVRLCGPLNWRQSQANLVIFNRWLILRASRADRFRFWLAYVKNRHLHVFNTGIAHPPATGKTFPRSHPAIRHLAREVESATHRSNERFWRRREQRCFQVTRHHQRIRTDSLQGYAVTDLDPDLLRLLQEDPEAPFRRPDIRVLKDSRSTKVVEFSAGIAGKQRQVVYKRFEVTDWYDPVLALLRPSPAIRSWLYGHSLRERGLPTARPLAVFHRRRRGLPYEGFLLMEKINSQGDLRTILDRLKTLEPTCQRRLLRLRLEQLARLIRELHHRHLAHRDLKAANILLNADCDLAGSGPISDSPVPNELYLSPFCFIDLVGVSRPTRLTLAIRVKNLARLHASFYQDQLLTRTDKLRFLRAYLQWGIFGREGWKEWWRKIENATQSKIIKNLRNGRPLG